MQGSEECECRSGTNCAFCSKCKLKAGKQCTPDSHGSCCDSQGKFLTVAKTCTMEGGAAGNCTAGVCKARPQPMCRAWSFTIKQNYDWPVVSQKHCHFNKFSKTYRELNDAMDACAKLGAECSGVYVPSCDSARFLKYLCKAGAFASAAGSEDCVCSRPTGPTITADAATSTAAITKATSKTAAISTAAITKTPSKTAATSTAATTKTTSKTAATSAATTTASITCGSWSESSNQHCHGNTFQERYRSISAAKAACVQLGTKCMGVYVGDCDLNVGYLLFLCKAGTGFHTSSRGSCVCTPPITTAPTSTTTTLTTTSRVNKVVCGSWSQANHKFCQAVLKEIYTSHAAAQAACLREGARCTGVYDWGCDDTGVFQLCTLGLVQPSDKGSCVCIRPTTAAPRTTVVSPTTTTQPGNYFHDFSLSKISQNTHKFTRSNQVLH